jgi:hypothetical protein
MLFHLFLAVLPFFHNVQEVADWLPTSETAIEMASERSILEFQENLDRLLSIPALERTFDNTIRAWDSLL